LDEQALDRNEGKSDSISSRLEEITAHLEQYFSDTPDMVLRYLTIGQTGERAILAYIAGLTDKSSLHHDVLRPLQELRQGSPGDDLIIDIGHIVPSRVWSLLENNILQGNSLLFIEGRTEAYILDTHGWPQRAIEDPQMEPSLKGAHQGLLETGEQSIAMIRRYIPNRELKMKRLTVGRRGQTIVTIMYLEDVAEPEFITLLAERIQALDIDVIINTGELAEFIEDNPYSLFPQFIMTERPDTAASQILQGRCAVVVDRSPSVLIAPTTFFSYFQSIDDYSTRWSIATFLRLLRLFAFLTAAFLPGIYIAVVSYHIEIIPMKLLLTLGESRGQVPFQPFVEAVFMEITLEMLREAGVRLPAPVGQTVGIVGGIVIGQAVVQAGLISNIMVIVVAFTAISSFILPNYDMVAAVRLIRFGMMILAWLFGFVGLIVGMMTMIAHLLSLKSLGMPYASPLGPVRFADWKDTLVRVPIWLMGNRPKSTTPLQKKRQGENRMEEGEQ
jgi:spore germination protein